MREVGCFVDYSRFNYVFSLRIGEMQVLASAVCKLFCKYLDEKSRSKVR